MISLLLLCLLCSSCGSARKVTAQQLEERVAELESQNRVLKNDVKNLQLQLAQVMEQVADKPIRGGNGGARPIDDGEGAQQLADNLTAIQLPEVQYDFGTIAKNSKVTHTFVVRNVGNNPLVIENVKASCGCTVPKWPKEPVPVGEETTIEVTFDSAGKRGVQNKAITITANTDPVYTRLYIKATIPK